ncbi:hypothetical protein BSL78_16503 [Apostichopus japonicus]|uniref:Copper transport protein n=1 Tax=Stichopus japonicus TaxID=307972 RepID=A0A2G8KF50_STIJA|nr:hypothetical protein BSL78_16503 [Apostichopus japonicus]
MLNIAIPEFKISIIKDQALLLIGLAILAVLLEFLQTFSDVVKRKIVNKISKSEKSSRFSCEVTETVEYGATLQRVHLTISQSLLLNLIVTSLHIIKILLAYMLMLAVMTFNYWVLLVIVLAAVVGYFLRPLTEVFICWSSTSSQHENIVAKDEERRPYIPLRESSV